MTHPPPPSGARAGPGPTGVHALWRLLAAAPVAFIVLLLALERAALGSGLAAALGFASLAFAAALWSRRLAVRLFGYAGHALVLALGFGAGAVLALVNEVGGLEGEPRGPTWASAALGAGALASAAALLPLVALLVWDVKQPRS